MADIAAVVIHVTVEPYHDSVNDSGAQVYVLLPVIKFHFFSYTISRVPLDKWYTFTELDGGIETTCV